MKKVIQKVVAAGIILNNNKVLIIQRAASDTFPNMWEVPSGKREEFETTINAVTREVKEETNLEVEVLSPIGVFEFKTEKESEIRDVTQICFICKVVGDTDVKLSDEHQNFVWVGKDELDSYNLSKETKENIILAFLHSNFQ